MNTVPKVVFTSMLLLSAPLAAEDVEPRRWTPLPVGTSVLGAGYVYTSGDIAFDPVLKVEGATLDARTWALSFLHAFDALGNLARSSPRSMSVTI